MDGDIQNEDNEETLSEQAAALARGLHQQNDNLHHRDVNTTGGHNEFNEMMNGFESPNLIMGT